MRKSANRKTFGDLKLYRLCLTAPPSREAASRSRSVLLDGDDMPITKIHRGVLLGELRARLCAVGDRPAATMNDKENNLGLPLPSGRVAALRTRWLRRIRPTSSGWPDYLARPRHRRKDRASALPGGDRVVPGPTVSSKQRCAHPGQTASRSWPAKATRKGASISPGRRASELSDAQPYAVQVEMRVYVQRSGDRESRPVPVAQKNGQPILRLTVPAANSDATIRCSDAGFDALGQFSRRDAEGLRRSPA